MLRPGCLSRWQASRLPCAKTMRLRTCRVLRTSTASSSFLRGRRSNSTSGPVARARRTASGHFFAEITILVDGATSVADAHDFTDEVERALARELGAAEAIVHVEPI